MKKRISTLLLMVVLLLGLCFFIGCATKIPITFTEPARLNMSGINRIAIESNNPQLASTLSQRLTSAGKQIGTVAEVAEWRAWNEIASRQAQAVTITAVNLARAYSENVPRADSNYGNGKTLIITGVVSEIDQMNRQYYVSLTGQGNEMIMIFFNASELSRIQALNKGQTINVVGDCYGRNVPRDESIAEILRLLGGSRTINVDNANFTVPNTYPGALDGLITVNVNPQVNRSTSTVTQSYRGSDGQTYTQQVPSYDTKVVVNISYQVMNIRNNSIVGQGTKTATSNSSSTTDSSQLPAIEQNLMRITLVRPQNEFIGEVVPLQRTIEVTLAKETENNIAKKEMGVADRFVKSKDYAAAANAYGEVFANHKNFAAGYNQAVLTEATLGTEAAIVLMEVVFSTTNNPLAQTTLNQMHERNTANQRAAAQVSQ